jgi:hypothetical protein
VGEARLFIVLSDPVRSHEELNNYSGSMTRRKT